jgi:DUF1680 family protein
MPHDAVALATDGWLGEWQQRNAKATLPHVLEHIESGEARANLARLAGSSEQPFHGMPFTDSDVHKTLEALAWAAGVGHVERDLLARGEKLIYLLQKVQTDDGYLNSYVQGTPGIERWSDPQWGHELYTAGHLFQAAVAAGRTGVFGDLPAIAERMATLLVGTHGGADNPYIDGHPQVETALVELYRLSGEVSYLELARQQLERRGRSWLGAGQFGSAYFQDHTPIRDAIRATGHAVRQLYLLTGAVDVAVECHDHELLAAAERIWQDLFHTKTYVSGAHGSRHRDEAIGDPYELPPDRAYAETCAAIASFQLNWRLLLATGSARYADAMEIALYNAIAVSTSVDGIAFFYSNPLQVRTGHDGSQEDVASQRRPWFSCACCPPNLVRLLASVHDYLATTTPRGVALHQYSAGTVDALVDDLPVRIKIATNYPYDQAVRMTVETAAVFELTLRIPAWCTRYSVAVDGERQPVQTRDGYLTLARDWAAGAEVELILEMPVRVVQPHPHLDAVRGCVAIMRGPVLFALEQADLPTEVVLEDARLITVHPAAPSPIPGLSPVVVPVQLTVTAANPQEELYQDSRADPAASVRLEAMLYPYHRWANRSRGAMRVWIPRAVGDLS